VSRFIAAQSMEQQLCDLTVSKKTMTSKVLWVAATTIPQRRAAHNDGNEEQKSGHLQRRKTIFVALC